ncbi:lysoplasmalogenase [Streptacidiphilus sp. ASG 303]|uniref:lysoplasmalogenase n=1 Tax=Streptacidiphilus sp. ASG 303 TaxID=2896847 RepID=UPI001E65C1F3|nr:lysoplasmalogenase [Streptacidiphilus sp. ASG 303]MCD0481414.1 lysoplasmalogenase [Streptacidiphilus sp. ASG 303]
MTPRRRALARTLLCAFALAAAAHLAALLGGVRVLELATKPVLMPLLAGYAAAASDRLPRLLTAALLCGAAGDALLEAGGPAFLAGMGAFAAGHVCYVVLLTRLGALADRRRAALRAAAYAIVWAVAVGLLWSGLGVLRAPVALYSLLLTATAATSGGLGARAGLGGALFLLSDTLIAVRMADRPLLPGHDVWVMATYLAAQYLLATAVLRAGRPRPGAPADPLPRTAPAAGAPV